MRTRKAAAAEAEPEVLETELPIETEQSSEAVKFPPVEILKMKTQVIYPTNGVQFKFKTERRGNVPVPVAVRVTQEGGQNCRLDFFYKTNGAPRNGNGSMNMEIFDRSVFIIQTGVDEKTGNPKGKAFSKLVCIASLHNTIPGFDERLEQLTCLTEENVDWDEKQVAAYTMAPTLQVK